MVRDLFFRRPRNLALPLAEGAQQSEADTLWIRCPTCHELLYVKEYQDNLRVCHKCKHHFQLSWRERLELLLDDMSCFEEHDASLRSSDPLHFRWEGGSYADKLVEHERTAGTPEALVYGLGSIESIPLVVAVNNYAFQAGSMGVAVGEKIARAIDLAVARRLPLLIVSASGGARQHEGVFSLMQMAKTVTALSRLGPVMRPYISLLTDPTLGGVPASYAMLGDINIAETGAYIGFAGPRVIETAIRQKLPPGTAIAASLLEHGMVDLVCARAELRTTIARLLRLLTSPSYRLPDGAIGHRAEVAAGLLTEERSLGD